MDTDIYNVKRDSYLRQIEILREQLGKKGCNPYEVVTKQELDELDAKILKIQSRLNSLLVDSSDFFAKEKNRLKELHDELRTEQSKKVLIYNINQEIDKIKQKVKDLESK